MDSIRSKESGSGSSSSSSSASEYTESSSAIAFTGGALAVFKARWQALKEFSVARLYDECDQQQFDFGTEEELAMYLARVAKEKTDAIIASLKQDNAVVRGDFIQDIIRISCDLVTLHC